MFYKCVVNEVGPVIDDPQVPGDAVYINLTETATNPPLFTGQWFLAATSMQNQMLAVALAAINGNKQVEAGTDPPNPDNTPFTQISRLYLIAS